LFNHNRKAAGEKFKHLVTGGQVRCRDLFHYPDFSSEPFLGNRFQQRLFAVKKAVEIGRRHACGGGEVGHRDIRRTALTDEIVHDLHQLLFSGFNIGLRTGHKALLYYVIITVL
jgi:hypothetical protein